MTPLGTSVGDSGVARSLGRLSFWLKELILFLWRLGQFHFQRDIPLGLSMIASDPLLQEQLAQFAQEADAASRLAADKGGQTANPGGQNQNPLDPKRNRKLLTLYWLFHPLLG
jgi:hypothetical protein